MSGKKMILIVLIALAVASFGASFFVSGWMVGDKQVAAIGAADGKKPDTLLAGVDPEKLSPKEQYLDDLIRDLKRKTSEYKRRERKLQEREKQVRIAREHLSREVERLDNLRVELIAPITRLKEAQAQIESARIRILQTEKTNLKWLASVYEKMDAAKGAGILERMCGNNKEDEAVKILRCMAERSAGKVIAEFTDQSLAARLCEKLKRVSEEG